MLSVENQLAFRRNISPSPSDMKMKVTYSSETSVDFQRTTRCCIPEDRTLHKHRYESLKGSSYISLHFVTCTSYQKKSQKEIFINCPLFKNLSAYRVS
jgi:hypothetical protein